MTKAMVKWHKSDLEKRMYLNVEGGKKIAMPRYYKDKMYTELERSIIAHFAKIDGEARQIERELKMYEEYGDDYPRIQAENDKASFDKMYKNSTRGRNKI